MNKRLYLNMLALVAALTCAFGTMAQEAYANYTPED